MIADRPSPGGGAYINPITQCHLAATAPAESRTLPSERKGAHIVPQGRIGLVFNPWGMDRDVRDERTYATVFSLKVSMFISSGTRDKL